MTTGKEEEYPERGVRNRTERGVGNGTEREEINRVHSLAKEEKAQGRKGRGQSDKDGNDCMIIHFCNE